VYRRARTIARHDDITHADVRDLLIALESAWKALQLHEREIHCPDCVEAIIRIRGLEPD